MPVHRMISNLDVIELVQMYGNYQDAFILEDAIKELVDNGLASAIEVLSGNKTREQK